MRPFEIVLLVALCLTFLAFLLKKRRDSKRALYIGLITFILMALQIMLEGQRWQLFLAYGLSFAFILLALIKINSRQYYLVKVKVTRAQRFKKWGSYLLGLVLLVFAWTLPVLMPIMDFTAPKGEQGVLRQQASFKSLEENYPMELWLPAGERAVKTEPYLAKGRGALSYLKYLGLHYHLKADLPEGRWPVLVFNHDQRGVTWQNTLLFMELASQGVAVVSLGHRLDASRNPSALGGQGKSLLDFLGEERFDWKGYQKLKTPKERRSFALDYWKKRQGLREDHQAWWLRMVTGLAELGRLNEERWQGRLDLENLILAGHGFGGSLAVFLCEGEPRCKASVNLNGMLLGVDQVPQKPLLSLHSDKLDSLVKALAESPRHRLIRLNGMEHWDLTDLRALWPSIRIPGLLSSLEPTQTEGRVRGEVVGFVKEVFAGTGSMQEESGALAKEGSALAGTTGP